MGEGTAEVSVGSRHVDGGGVGFEWSVLRRVVSRGATLLAWPVAACSDPMSGFFCVSKEVLQRGDGRFNLIGFKIGLEIMVRCRCRPVKDVAITFRERTAGESKLTASQYIMFLQQLASLYWDRYGVLAVIQLMMSVTFIILLVYEGGQLLLR